MTKTQNKSNKAPSLNDTEAFPDAGWGTGSVSAAPANGKSFASLTAESGPPEKAAGDLGDGPIRIKVKRPPQKPRITKVRENYRGDLKKIGTYSMYHDEGVPAGVSEKKAPCAMDLVGKIESVKDLNKCLRDVKNLSRDEGVNIRVFKAQYEEPSAASDDFEKGGRYQISVGKDIAENMFEELAIYLMDSRLENAIVGVCWCIRDSYDLIQLWTKNASSTATNEVFIEKLLPLIGAEARVSYARFADAFSHKAPKAKKYYNVEGGATCHPDDVASSVNSIVQMREPPSKKDKKQGKTDGFTEIAMREKPTGRKVTESPTLGSSDGPDVPSGVAASNLYSNIIDDEEEEPVDAGEEIKFFEKKKSQNTRKGSSKKGSRKLKSNDSDFDGLTAATGPIVSQQMFVGGGLGLVLLVAMLAVFMSGVVN